MHAEMHVLLPTSLVVPLKFTEANDQTEEQPPIRSELNPSIVCQTPLQSFPPASLLSLPLGIDWTLANALPRVPIAIGLLETLPRDRSTCIGYRGPQERGHGRACRYGRRREGKGNLYAAIDRHEAEPLPLHPRASAATALKF